MKRTCPLFVCIICFVQLAPLVTAWSQDGLRNLGFESAVIVPVPGDPFGRIQFAEAFPSWTGQIGLDQQTLALYNNLFIGSPGIALLGPGFSGVIEGDYTLVLQTGSALDSPDVSIRQFGIIPGQARSVQFVSSGARNGFVVTVNGESLSMSVLGMRGSYSIYGGDVSSFAGQTVDFSITELSAFGRPSNMYLDSIVFSADPVPEPSIFALSALGSLVLGFWRWRSFRAR